MAIKPEWEASLDALGELAEDWDSYGADVISLTAIAKARSILGNFTGDTSFSICPESGGGVLIEWKIGSVDCHVGISPNGEVEVYVGDNSESVLFRI